MNCRLTIGAATVILLFAACRLAASETAWPQFRGPSGDGIAPNADPPAEWSETKNVAWKVALAFHGRSSPVLQGDRIWLTTANEQGVKRMNITGDDMQVATHVTLGSGYVVRPRRNGHRLADQSVPHEVAPPY